MALNALHRHLLQLYRVKSLDIFDSVFPPLAPFSAANGGFHSFDIIADTVYIRSEGHVLEILDGEHAEQPDSAYNGRDPARKRRDSPRWLLGAVLPQMKDIADLVVMFRVVGSQVAWYDEQNLVELWPEP